MSWDFAYVQANIDEGKRPSWYIQGQHMMHFPGKTECPCADGPARSSDLELDHGDAAVQVKLQCGENRLRGTAFDTF